MEGDWTEGLTENQASELRLTFRNMEADGLLVSEGAKRRIAARLRTGEIGLHEAERELVKASNPPG